MLTAQLIENYLATHPVLKKLEDKHMGMLRTIFFGFACGNDTDFFAETTELLNYCNKELTNHEWPEPAIAKIANRALEMFFERSKDFANTDIQKADLDFS